jgi:RNA polymerase sigma-70 factor (ECF subfamily)
LNGISSRRSNLEAFQGSPLWLYPGQGLEATYGQAEFDDDPVAALAFSLKEAVNELPEPYRRSMILTEFQGMTQTELAEKEGITLGAAKSRILRAREKLKALLLDCCHFELDNRGRIINYEKRCAQCDLLRHASNAKTTPPVE